jgi:cytochrome c-type biogenesis protein CcmE
MKIPPNTLRIGIAVAIIVATIGWLAISGAQANKSYYVTIAELGGMGDKAYHSQLRVEGFVQPGSIEHSGPHVTFVLNEFESHSPSAPSGHLLKVVYKGSEPPPDTFKDDAQALAEGTFGRDGVFHATVLQAKCASKYAPAQPGTSQPGTSQPGAAPAQPAAGSSANPRAAAAAPAVQPSQQAAAHQAAAHPAAAD